MLSEHFSLEEMSYSRIAVEQAIDNEPPETEREAMRHLAIHLLEPLRLLYGAPIAILSGFRNRKVMASISGDYTRQQTGTVSTETKTQRIFSGYIRPLLLIIGFGLAGAFFVYRTVSG